MTKEIVNRVQNSGLVTLEMKSFYGDQERVLLDIKYWLYEGLILKEKPFRKHLKNHDWSIYKNKFVEFIAVKIPLSLFGHSCWYQPI